MEMSNEQLVELITHEVKKALSSVVENEPPISGRTALIIGDVERLPMSIREKYSFCGIEAYEKCGDISRFECIYVTRLSTAELADFALGRGTRRVQCALVNAMLCGKDVFILESAFEHRSFAASCSRAFYKMLEGYVFTLQSFGVKILREQFFGKALPRDIIAENSADKVITEAKAVKLVGEGGEKIRLLKGTVITPSARDVFNHSGKTVEFVE